MLGLVASACGKSKTCSTQPADSFVGSDVPNAELATALKEVASRNKVCATNGEANIVMSGSRSNAVETLDAAMKKAGFHDVPGRDRSGVRR